MEKRYSARAAILLGLLAACLANTVFAEDRPLAQRVLIGFKDGLGQQAAENHRIWVRDLGGEVHYSFRFLPLVSAGLPEHLIAKLKDRPEIAYIENDITMHAIGQEIAWGVQRIGADHVWSTNTGKGVNVAILDTGVDYDHPDLAGNIAGGINYAGSWWKDGSTNKLYWDDKYGHGSYCAGIVAALNNNIGVVGVAPGARLWVVKVLGDDGYGYISDIIQGLEWCVDNAVDIASMSFGAAEYSESLANACNAAYDAGVLLVAAAGNEKGGPVIYPAAYGSVIAVSATNTNDVIADFSSIGPEVELAAPGVSIKSTYRSGGYAIGSGTSMACPHVAGAAALAWAADPSLTAGQLRIRLRQTAEDLGAAGRDNLYGYGLVNASAASQAADIHDVAVTAIAAPSSAFAGDTVAIDVTVQNEGTFSEAFGVVLTDNTDAVTIGTRSVSLAASTSTTVSFSWDTTDAAASSHTLTARAGPVANETDTVDNSRSTTVAVERPTTDIAVTAVTAPSSVVQSDLVSVGVTIKNAGNQDVTSNITVALSDDTDGITIGTQTITGGLAAGDSSTINFPWNTSGASIGNHTLTAHHDFADDGGVNNSTSTTVTMQEKPAVPIAHLDVDVSKQTFWTLWRSSNGHPYRWCGSHQRSNRAGPLEWCLQGECLGYYAKWPGELQHELDSDGRYSHVHRRERRQKQPELCIVWRNQRLNKSLIQTDRFAVSFLRKQESINISLEWIPACAGMTKNK